MKNKKIIIVFCSVILLIMFGSCPTPYLNLPIVDNYMERMEKELEAEIAATLEFEDGSFAKITTGEYASNPEWGSPMIANSDLASGGRFVKEISYKHGRVDITVPNTVTADVYIVAIGYSGSPTGVVTITLNPGEADEEFWPNIPYNKNGTDWDMADPHSLLITRAMNLKPGDIIRAHNGLDSAAADPALNYIHLDALFILKEK